MPVTHTNVVGRKRIISGSWKYSLVDAIIRDETSALRLRKWWSSVDGQKRCKKVSVDEKRLIRFKETENGAFRKRIVVDKALVL